MARNTKFLSISARVFLVLILCHEVLVTEARQLRYDSSNNSNSSSDDFVASSSSNEHAMMNTFMSTNGQKAVNTAESIASKMMETMDDFRPTEPGRSPGAGHSVHD